MHDVLVEARYSYVKVKPISHQSKSPSYLMMLLLVLEAFYERREKIKPYTKSNRILYFTQFITWIPWMLWNLDTLMLFLI